MVNIKSTIHSNSDLLIYQDFALALVYFSKGQVNPEEAKQITKDVLGKVDLDNSAVAHKGINWLARETLKRRQII